VNGRNVRALCSHEGSRLKPVADGADVGLGMGSAGIRPRVTAALFTALAVFAVAASRSSAATAPHPAILSVKESGVTAGHPAAVGTQVVLSVTVRAATTCAFRAQHQPFSSLYLVRTVPCTSGHARVAMPRLKNPFGKTSPVVYLVSVKGRGGATQKRLSISVAPASTTSTGTTSTTPPATTTPTPAPTPPAQPTPAAPVAATPVAPMDLTAWGSPNWSGYYVGGGPFTAVTGTFNVPLLSPATGETHTSAWVGIDGADNDSLIQAGIAEKYDPTTNTVYGHAWWEILPALETPIPMTIYPGDQMSVSIGLLGGTTWEIVLTDVTRNLTFVTDQTYAGQTDSAEWIVEAPSILPPGSTDPSTATVATLGAYSPNITFGNLKVNGTQSSLNIVQMEQNGSVVSVPSPLTPNGFTVAYGSAAPPGP
jgi:hypothetical protein